MAHPTLFMRRILRLFLSTGLLHAVCAQTTAASPTIALITGPKFFGYSSTSSATAWEPQYCPTGSTWTSSSTWARCCPTGKNAGCSMYTSCVVGSTSLIVKSGGDTGSCPTGNPVCRTAVISQDSKDQNPLLYVGCGTANWTAYRTPPAAVVITLTPTAETTGSSISKSTGTATSTGATSSATSSPKSSNSKVWIAGAVLGPIFLIAVAGLLAYIWILRKRQAQKQDESAAPMMGGALGGHPVGDPRQSYQGAYYPQPYGDQPSTYTSSNLQPPIQMAPVELSSARQIVEAPNEPMSPVGRK